MADIDMLRCIVGQHEFENPLLFGGGTCKTLPDVIRALQTDAGGLEIGSITPNESLGNLGSKVFYARLANGVLIYTLNSLGLPNPGRYEVSTWAKEAIARAHDRGKKIGMNIAASTVVEILDMVEWSTALGFDWTTINAGCPNKFDASGRPVAVLGFDEDAVADLVERLDARFDGEDEIWYKPPPFTDTVGALPRTASLIERSATITGYVANNTVAHCFAFDEDGTPAISPGGGLAGMAGPAVGPIVDGHLQLLKGMLPIEISRIGAGGVVSGRDMLDRMRSGADLVMIASVVWANPQGQYLGYGEANRILAELLELPDLERHYHKAA